MTAEEREAKKKAVRELLDGAGCEPTLERWKKEPTLDEMIDKSNRNRTR